VWLEATQIVPPMVIRSEEVLPFASRIRPPGRRVHTLRVLASCYTWLRLSGPGCMGADRGLGFVRILSKPLSFLEPTRFG
jgi:hypothetical protein